MSPAQEAVPRVRSTASWFPMPLMTPVLLSRSVSFPTATPKISCRVAALLTVVDAIVPVAPRAESWATRSSPALTMTWPVKVLLPESSRSPSPSLVIPPMPVLLITASITSSFRSSVGDNTAPTDDEVLKTALRRFSEELQIQPVRNSQLVQVSFTAYDRELSAKVPNMLAELYIESDRDAAGGGDGQLLRRGGESR